MESMEHSYFKLVTLLPSSGPQYLFEMIDKWPARVNERMGWGIRSAYAESWVLYLRYT
jgi:hypothetical protein